MRANSKIDKSPFSKNHLLFVNFHHVRPAPPSQFPGLHFITPEAFKSQLERLGQLFDFPAPSVVADALVFDRELGKASVVLSFDDGLRDQAEFVLPILAQLGIKAIFSVCTAPWNSKQLLPVHLAHLLSAAFSYLDLAEDLENAGQAHGVIAKIKDLPLELGKSQYRYDDPHTARVKYFLNAIIPQSFRTVVLDQIFRKRLGDSRAYHATHYMTENEIAFLTREGHSLALHSHSHLHLASATLEERHADLKLNAKLLQTISCTNEPIRWISYPYGGPTSYDDRVISDAVGLGCQVGLTMRRGINTISPTLDRMRLARVDTHDAPGGRKPLEWEVYAHN